MTDADLTHMNVGLVNQVFGHLKVDVWNQEETEGFEAMA